MTTTLASTLACVALLAWAPPDAAPPQPQPEPAAQPQPAQPQPAAQPQPQPVQPQPAPPQPQPVQPQPAPPQPQPYQQQPYQQQPYQQPQPTPAPAPEQPKGIGMLVAGPLLVAIGVPFNFLGNTAWRDNCGPTNTDGECFAGSTAAAAGHVTAGLSYGVGILLTGLGGQRLGQSDARNGLPRNSAAFLAPGAVLLPTSLAAMGLVRLLLWLPTPDCQTYACVQQYQTTSSIAVSALAMTASAGAGLLMYGAGYQSGQRRLSMRVSPRIGRDYAGLQLGGRF